VEAQFIEGGDWVLSRGTAEGVEAEKSILFGKYADAITELPPSCLATLRRLLQACPITTVFSGGGKPPHVNSHEGFALRMPAAEVFAEMCCSTVHFKTKKTRGVLYFVGHASSIHQTTS